MASAACGPPWASSAPPEHHHAVAVSDDSADTGAEGVCGVGAAPYQHVNGGGPASDPEPPEKRRRTASGDAKMPTHDVSAEVEVVDLCDSDDDAPAAPPADTRHGGGGAQLPSDDEVVFVDVSALAPELLARWEAESQQRLLRRLQKRAAAAGARAQAGSQPAVGGFNAPPAAWRDDPLGGGGAPQDLAHGQGPWNAVADDWRRKNAAGVPPDAPKAKRTPKPGASRGTPLWRAGGHAWGEPDVRHPGGGEGGESVAGSAAHGTQPSEQDTCDALRSRLVSQLQRMCAGCVSLGSILMALGSPPEGWPWSTETQLRAAYRAAALKYHPDRSQGEPLADRMWKEEVFKLIARAKAGL